MSNFNILVVEDEDAIREMLLMVLEQSGFMAFAAADAETSRANEAIASTLWDVIMCLSFNLVNS